jgi:hypothetical protein
MRSKLPMFAILAGLALALAALPGVASAHETRTVADKYKFVVGFLNEPAIADQVNSIDLTVTDATTTQPILGLEKSLKAQIIFGGETEDVTLAPRGGSLPGKYTGYVIPTKSGTWKFHFTGKVNNDSIDETFTSGPGRFSDVEPAQTLQFPVKAPPLAELSGQASSAQAAAASAQSAARTGTIVGVAGIVVGAFGLIAGGFALSQVRRERTAAAPGAPKRRPT